MKDEDMRCAIAFVGLAGLVIGLIFGLFLGQVIL